MPTRSDLHNYQVRAVTHIGQHPQSMLWLDMGLGKTIITLTAISDLINAGMTTGVLILGPLRVIQSVWEFEARKWEHTRHLTFSMLHGTKEDSVRNLSMVNRNIYLCNYEGLPRLASQIKERFLANGRLPPFDTIIFDEVTRVKNTRDKRTGDTGGGKRAEALLDILPYMPRRVGLTGTPAPNGLIDLFGQYLMLDEGARLGRSVETYKSRFFTGVGYGGYTSVATAAGKQHINDLIAPITLRMKGEDYLPDLPKVVENLMWVHLTPKLRKQYDLLERDLFAELDSGASITAVNTLSLMTKLFQFTNGAVYLVPGEPQWERIHDLKLDALEEAYDSHGQKPLLVAYKYIHDMERIVKRFSKRGAVVVLNSKVKGEAATEIIRRWNAGEIPFLVGHRQSIGHGLNLQVGSNHLVDFGVDYNLEFMLQFAGRLARQGQPEAHVFQHKILAKDTLDEVVLADLSSKQATEETLKESIESYRKKRGLL